MKLTKGNILLCEDPEISARSFRELGQSILTCIDGSVDDLEEPLKGQFMEVKSKVNSLLAGFQDTDRVPAALRADSALRTIRDNMLMVQSMVEGVMNLTKSKMQLASDEINTKADERVQTLLASGDFIRKEEFEEKAKVVSDEAVNAVHAEYRAIGDRRVQLAADKVPVPSDDVLKSEDFDSRKALAMSRLAELKPFKLSEERVVQLCWAEASDYENQIGLVKELSEKAPVPVKTRVAIGATGGSGKSRFAGVC